jgi:predicted dehydrogenase
LVTEKKVHWGILGTARIAAERLIPAFHESEIAELVAVASRNRDRTTNFANKHQIPKAYASYDELLADDSIDAVYIPLPNHLHRKWAIHAMAAGKHVLCEKPLSTSATDGIAMFEESEKNNVLLMEGFMYRFHPQTRRVRELLAKGTIGRPHLIRVAHSFPLHLQNRDKDFRWREEGGGGSLADLGVYCVDTARHLFSANPARVFAASSYHPDYSAEAETRAILTFPDDRVAVFDSSFLLTGRREYEVVGDEGRITAFDTYNPDRGVDIRIEIEAMGRKIVEVISAENEYLLEVDHFSTCILQNEDPVISRQDSIGNLRVLDALRESAHQGIPVEMSLAG